MGDWGVSPCWRVTTNRGLEWIGRIECIICQREPYWLTLDFYTRFVAPEGTLAAYTGLLHYYKTNKLEKTKRIHARKEVIIS